DRGDCRQNELKSRALGDGEAGEEDVKLKQQIGRSQDQHQRRALRIRRISKELDQLRSEQSDRKAGRQDCRENCLEAASEKRRSFRVTVVFHHKRGDRRLDAEQQQRRDVRKLACPGEQTDVRKGQQVLQDEATRIG